MRVGRFLEIIDADFYTGVPDSQLSALCNYLMAVYGIDPKHHVIAANEGNCTALAAGYYLSTGRVPVVYMQNSGLGNAVNPITSLLNEKVYAIPAVFIIGWRGEPGTHDEPQHIFQGEVTMKLLEDMDIAAFVVGKETTEEELSGEMVRFRQLLAEGKSVAFVIRKGALTEAPKVEYRNEYQMPREEVIRHIVQSAGSDPIVCTTGKAGRELFEIRQASGQSHQYDFLTVGSMGHCASIALGVAVNCPKQRIWCIDGDGAALMHMGSMAVLGTNRPPNLIHVIINNGAHESVGGMPTAAGGIDFPAIAKACGYPNAVSVENMEELDRALEAVKHKNELCFLEAKCSIGARWDLGRPTTTALESRRAFMEYLAALESVQDLRS